MQNSGLEVSSAEKMFKISLDLIWKNCFLLLSESDFPSLGLKQPCAALMDRYGLFKLSISMFFKTRKAVVTFSEAF